MENEYPKMLVIASKTGAHDFGNGKYETLVVDDADADAEARLAGYHTYGEEPETADAPRRGRPPKSE